MGWELGANRGGLEGGSERGSGGTQREVRMTGAGGGGWNTAKYI